MQTADAAYSETTIASNGSRWYGEEVGPVDQLLAALAEHPLARRFEVYGNFIFPHEEAGRVEFWGNFYAISHVFHVITRDASLIERLTKAIRANQERPDYLAQPLPEPLPACQHCDPTANPPSECGRH